MHKRTTLLLPKSTLTPSEFRHHWAHRHGPLVCDLPGLAAYRQHDVQAIHRGPACLGIVEAGFADAAALAAAFQSAQAAALLPDERNFIGAKLVMDVGRTQFCDNGHGTDHFIVMGRSHPGNDGSDFIPAPDLLSDYRLHRVLRTIPHAMELPVIEPDFFNIFTVKPGAPHETSARAAEILAQIETALDPATSYVFATRSREIIRDRHGEAAR